MLCKTSGGSDARALDKIWSASFVEAKFEAPLLLNTEPGAESEQPVGSLQRHDRADPLLRDQGGHLVSGREQCKRSVQVSHALPADDRELARDFKQGDFSFYFVQLAPFLAVTRGAGDRAWAELREAHDDLRLPKTGMAVITDFGNEYDIHPTPKQPVGERLALIARAKDCWAGEHVVSSGPTYKGMKIAGDKVILTFGDASSGLTTKKLVPTLVREKQGVAWRVDPDARDAELVGFTVCGKDRVQDGEGGHSGERGRRQQPGDHRAGRGSLRLGQPSDLQPLQPRRPSAKCLTGKIRAVQMIQVGALSPIGMNTPDRNSRGRIVA